MEDECTIKEVVARLENEYGYAFFRKPVKRKYEIQTILTRKRTIKGSKRGLGPLPTKKKEH